MFIHFGLGREHRSSCHFIIMHLEAPVDVRRRCNLRDFFFSLFRLQACPWLLASLFIFVFNMFLTFPASLSFVVFFVAAFFFFLFSSTDFLPSWINNFARWFCCFLIKRTYRIGKRNRGFSRCYGFPSGRPKGEALIQHRKTYRLPRLCNGITSPNSVSMRHPIAFPKRDSKPMSAQRLKDRSALRTSATCMLIVFAALAPSVHISHFFSLRFGIDAPVAPSYSIPWTDWYDGVIGIFGHIVFGITVSQAPVSAVNSTSNHYSVGAVIGQSDAFVAVE